MADNFLERKQEVYELKKRKKNKVLPRIPIYKKEK